MDYYKTLQVDPAADPEVIEAAYHRLARKIHPDLNPAPDATTRMAAINEAYEVLRDPARRARYDQSRTNIRPRHLTPRRPEIPRPERTGSLVQKIMAALIVLMIVGLIAAMGWAMGGGF